MDRDDASRKVDQIRMNTRVDALKRLLREMNIPLSTIEEIM
jgi:hypothetical protein